jgi:hypothetical protein
MRDRPKNKGSKHRHFWRACRYLWPYRAKVTVSIIAAFFVGLALTGGLTTMIPIMNVIFGGDTIQSWMYRRMAEHRLNLNFVPVPTTVVQVARTSDGPARRAGIQVGDVIIEAVPPGNAPRSPFPPTPGDPAKLSAAQLSYHMGDILRNIAWTNVTDRRQGGDEIQLTLANRKVVVTLAPANWYDPPVLKMVEFLPIKPVQAVRAVCDNRAAGELCTLLSGAFV